jgi:hypothetical protein
VNLLENEYGNFIVRVAGRYGMPDAAVSELREGFAAYCECSSLTEGKVTEWLTDKAGKALDWYGDKLYRAPAKTIIATMLALLGAASGIAVPAVKHDIACGHYWPTSVSEETVTSYGIDTEEGRRALVEKAEALSGKLDATNKEGQYAAKLLRAMISEVAGQPSDQGYENLVAMVECANTLLTSIETGTCANGDNYGEQVPRRNANNSIHGGAATLINLHNSHMMTHPHGKVRF